ncbi:MAG: ribosome silencing factor, partial [Clostridia bacterium]|nr:ribosome silencing factor [Clostridia bacterium]
SDVVVIDVSKLTVVTDYLVICHGNSRVHVQAISEGIEEELEKQGVNCLRREGFEDGRWIVLDYGDAIVHVFRQEERLYYNLERLWSDAPTIEQG